VTQAQRYRADGADVIDLGCDPGSTWTGVGDAVRALRDLGLRVSIDSMNPEEIGPAARAGAELVLSVNSSNRAAVVDWGVEVVAIPDEPGSLTGLDATVEHLLRAGVRFRIDPILEPIGFGFAASLGRCFEARRCWPETPMLLGVGNLTELTDADSAGINVLLAGFCQELGIHSVLTTEVAPWCRSSVRELDLARRLVAHAVRGRVLPKRLEPRLILLRDPKVHELGDAALAELAAGITDRNYRIFAERGELHVLNGERHLRGSDPFALFDAIQQSDASLDPSHAFYLGYELAKAVTALTLGKDYVQDQPLRWGFLTRPERGNHP
jgi:dihydropteroate synthase-like protein